MNEDKFVDKDILFKMTDKDMMAYRRLKKRMEEAGTYKPEYDHMLNLLAILIREFNQAEGGNKSKFATNISSISASLMLTPKSANETGGKKVESKDPAKELIMKLGKVN